jgi:hypothetical protein
MLESRVVRGQSIAQTFATAATGNAELGFVALSQALSYEGRSLLHDRSAGAVRADPAGCHPAAARSPKPGGPRIARISARIQIPGRCV